MKENYIIVKGFVDIIDNNYCFIIKITLFFCELLEGQNGNSTPSC
jgi:hypothetical protein